MTLNLGFLGSSQALARLSLIVAVSGGLVPAQTSQDLFASSQPGSPVVITRSTTKYPSPSGKHHLVFQPDGNFLVATAAGQYVWGMDRITPAYKHAASVHFGGGNIMIRQANNSLVWHAINPGAIKDANARLVLTPEGVLQLVSANGEIRWASDGKLGVSTPPAVAAVPAAPGNNDGLPTATRLPLPAGQSLKRGQKYDSPTRQHQLIFAADGNMVVTTSNGGYVWGLDQVSKNMRQIDRIELRADGSFGGYDAKGAPVWTAPMKRRDPAAQLNLTPKGVLQVAVPGGEILWASDGNLIVAPPTLPEATRLPVMTGQSLKRGQKYDSPSRMHQLLFAEDGNVILAGPKGEYAWGFDKVIKDLRKIDRVELRRDGSFIAADANGVTLWFAPMTRLDPSAQLTATFGGVLQVVTPKGDVLWASDGILTPTINVFGKPNATTCAPEPGWKTCIVLNDPKITIMAVSQASQQAIHAVANIYTEMTKRFNANYPKAKFDGYKIYLTNGQPWSALENLAPVGSMWPDKTGPKSGNILRGGASPNYLWIDEQMICKRGQQTNPSDSALRTYDQVIHEFGHAIDYKYDLRKRLQSVYANKQGYEEMFPQSIQAWFGAPGSGHQGGAPSLALMREIFSSQTAFSCEGYRP